MEYLAKRTNTNEDAYTNTVYGSDDKMRYVMINDYVYLYNYAPNVPINTMLFNYIMRRELGITPDKRITVQDYSSHFDFDKKSDIRITIQTVISSGVRHVFKEEELLEVLYATLNEHIISTGRTWITKIDNIVFTFLTQNINQNHAMLNQIVSIVSETPKIEIDKKQQLIRDIRISDLGVGGLDTEINYIFRRAFVSRTYSDNTIKKLGIDHIKGIILHGPPGTGKTLISRKLSEVLNCKSLKIVNGPEILDKFVGESEKKIRDLFAEAIADTTRGLHVVIFDELDCICKERSGGGSAGSQVQDSIVNQLLSKMDGVEKLDNILIIGMTNRIDLIDSALLRPGRFEVKVEISLPDANGRKQIFDIHMQEMKRNNFVDVIDTDRLVSMTNNFSGAEIAGVVRDAVSYVLNRNQDKNESEILIQESDFVKAINDASPMFGKKITVSDTMLDSMNLQISKYVTKPHIYWITDSNSEIIARHVACKIDSPNIVLINNYDLIGMDGYQKSKKIRDTISRALICTQSTIIFVRLEEILEYFDVNNHFNIQVAQSIRSILAKDYGGKLDFVISTSIEYIRDILNLQ